MSFRYFDAKSSGDGKSKVVDDQTGVELFAGGLRNDAGEASFTFFDPNTKAHFYGAVGKFRFIARLSQHVEKVALADGSEKMVAVFDGYEIDRRPFEHTFSPYTSGDPQKVEAVCVLISQGLREWSRHHDHAENVTVKFV